MSIRSIPQFFRIWCDARRADRCLERSHDMMTLAQVPGMIGDPAKIAIEHSAKQWLEDGKGGHICRVCWDEREGQVVEKGKGK